MVNISAVQNYNICHNIYSSIQTKAKSLYNRADINFKPSVCLAKRTILSAAVAIAFLKVIQSVSAGNKSEAYFENYFDKISLMPSKVYSDENFIKNPELLPYAEELDNLTPNEKKNFVKIFCKTTGFPDLTAVQEKMNNEIKNAIDITLKDTDSHALFAGYSSCCSMGKGTAFPGSDCDGLFVIADKINDYTKVNKWTLSTAINQRLIESQGAHAPELFGMDELLPYIKISNEIFNEIKTPQKVENYKNNLLRSDQDFIKAGEFNLDIASKVTDGFTKDRLYLTAYFTELIRSGYVLFNNIDRDLLNYIKDSAMYKYSNVVRQEGFRDNIKPKWANRVKLASEFNLKPDEEKFEICSKILKASMGVANEQTDCYEQFDMGNILELLDKITTFGQYFRFFD